jgi:hypothetical protein
MLVARLRVRATPAQRAIYVAMDSGQLANVEVPSPYAATDATAPAHPQPALDPAQHPSYATR